VQPVPKPYITKGITLNIIGYLPW